MVVFPKIFLDTQIILNAERQQGISLGQWNTVSSYLRNTVRYVVSPLTIGEILNALANGGSQYFHQHQRRLALLFEPNPDAEVFDFTRYFVAEQFGASIPRPTHLESDFRTTVALILLSPSKEALLTGFEIPGLEPGATAKVRIDKFALEYQENLDGYVRFMSSRRQQGNARIDPEHWASFISEYFELFGEGVSSSELADRLSATYEFEMSVNRLMNNGNFSVAKNKSDHIDGQQLMYLCDPSAIFITNDSDFRNRIASSSQSVRIKSFAELLYCAERGLSLL